MRYTKFLWEGIQAVAGVGGVTLTTFMTYLTIVCYRLLAIVANILLCLT